MSERGPYGPRRKRSGRHVGRRAQQRAVDRQALPDRRLGRQLGDAEVEDLRDLAARRAVQEHVRGLDVAMDQAGGVRRRERRAHRHADLGRAQRAQRAALLELLLERVALEQLHHQVRDAARVDAEVEHRDRVRVLHAARGGALAPEARERLGVGPRARRQDLHRHLAVELEVARAEHRPEAAAADRLVEAVASAQHAAGHRLRGAARLDRGRRLGPQPTASCAGAR